ncbi:transglutaminase family protein [uncultured Abyssibacter sp.]|uniref:transglutaminase family protein n=1 Tax=uncultured Abyssibacter sp. TaxID=2320202 RepID=UPI0032B18463
MSIVVALNHRTTYRYDRLVNLTPQIIRLRPAPHARTPVQSYSLKVRPEPHFLNWQQDPHNNWQARVVFPDKVDHFEVEVDLLADLAVFNPFDFFIEDWAEEVPFVYPDALAEDLGPYLDTPLPASHLGRRFAGLLNAMEPRKPMRTVDFLVMLNQRIADEVDYVIRMEPGVQTPEETLTKGRGSCRDSAWLLAQLLRHMGYATRFCSGYLIQLKPDVKSLDGPSGTDVDFTDLHAWCEVFIPGAGWVGLDSTSGLFCGEGHIPLTATPEPSMAAPVTGGVDPCEVTFEHDMSVQRIIETPRVTKPYTDDQWSAIDALGQSVDEILSENDVRLTQGGEPTFVSIDDFESAEWNTAAVGPTKEARARQLIGRLAERVAPGGLMTFGQGKWYPGESLPRWAYSLHLRRDGEPILEHDLPDTPSDKPPEALVTDARALTEHLAEQIGLKTDFVQPVYEDPWHYIRKERGLPENVDPLDSKLDDLEERTRLAAVFERGLNTPRGFVLPVQRQNSKAGKPWISELWKTRTRHLFLLPGDSPIGFRLPLQSLPWVEEGAYPQVMQDDPTEPKPPLERPPQIMHPSHRATPVDAAPAPQPAASEFGPVRTALTVEPRDGRLHVFMPPTQNAQDYLDLVAAIEQGAQTLGAPVRIEGYPPPSDPRLDKLSVTPDPGVIEVNVQPVADWDAMKEQTFGLYEDARQCRLGTEKFLIDGRAVGTGGGNHVVLGGPTTNDSPFLRRPDVLGSLIRYWQNHPSLSYLFSGLFIGPTSQSPRVDEARDDALYELGIALSELPRKGQDAPPWLVDRILRHLLTDLTGNTHRSEICIDKLYSPDSPTGRLGLIEFRGFEMPPHAQMSLVQQLLLRSLVAWFWETPYEAPLNRFGRTLHDRFLLPEFCWQDFLDVIADLDAAGFAFRPDWFAPHFEFRFPAHGTVTYRGITLELRHALEPWITLGEEPGAGGTARYVDSSTERVQIKVNGLTGDRFAIACNGRQVRLTPTGRTGESVAGVRFRAWKPWSALHPTLGADTPLIFDLVDTWNNRSLGGLTYHVAHPAGRSYDTFPVNAYEAESRRLSRFETVGHTPGPFRFTPAGENPDFPTTLDLRRS